MKKIILLFAAFIYFQSFSYSQPGQLDSSFGTNGLVPYQETYSRTSSIAVQTDGKIILSGEFHLSRYNSDGSVDSIFNNNVQIAERELHYDYRYNALFGNTPAIALQADGKIIALGPSYGMQRFNTDGSLDITFGDNGIQTTEGAYNSAVAIQSNGKIVVKGMQYDSHSVPYVILARYNANGGLDNTFNGNGKVVSLIKSNYSTDVNSLAIQSDGKIVIAGVSSVINLYQRFGIARYNSNGTVDNTFGNKGIKEIDFGGSTAATTVAIQADQKIVVAGVKHIGGDADTATSDICIARLNSDGTFDNSFSTDGKAVIDFGVNGSDFTNTVAIQDDGKILLGGSTFSSPYTFYALIRLNAAGNPDSTFNGNGIKLTNGFEDYGYYDGGRINDLAVYLNKVYAVYSAAEPYGRSWGVSGIARYLLGGVSVSITSPADNSAFNSPGPLNITADATNPDGSITKVDFYNGTTLLGTDYTSPYSYSWSNKLTGDHADYFLTAKATDNTGKVTTSPVVHVFEVKSQAPAVSFISPSNNAAYVAPATIEFKAEARDTQTYGGISKVEFFNGQTLLGTVTRSPYVFTWTDVPAGNYLITAKATDNTGLTATDKINVSVGINTPPHISITSPSDNAGYGAPATILFTADATDDNTVTEVEFYNGSTLLGTAVRYYPDSPSAYYFTWYNVPIGEYTITAKAIDNGGLTTISDPVHVTVVKNQPPTVSIVKPIDNKTYGAHASVRLIADAKDPNGAIHKVEFFSNNILIRTENHYPYTYWWDYVQAGTYTITAVVTDQQGLTDTSAPVHITVEPNEAPIVSIITPANHQTFTGPATINLEATAEDADGTIHKVEFYNGKTLLATERLSPYTFTWKDVPAGNYTITAKAFDNEAAPATSVINIIVTPSQGASIVSSRPSAKDGKTGENNAISLKLYPNPVNNLLSINIAGLQQNKPSFISVISASGILVKTVQANASSKVVQLDVSSLISGVYTVKIMSGDKVLYKQFVKL